jgi:glucokinase
MQRGENRLAAELGHMVVHANGRVCGCGHRGCLEAYASKTGMGSRLAKEVARHKRVTTLSEEGNDLSNVRSGLLAKAYRGGDRLACEVLDEAAWYLGLGVANVITALGPDRVVLGGGVFEALGPELLEKVRSSAAAHSFPPASFEDTQIVLAGLADDAVALGAVAHARDTLRVG